MAQYLHTVIMFIAHVIASYTYLLATIQLISKTITKTATV